MNHPFGLTLSALQDVLHSRSLNPDSQSGSLSGDCSDSDSLIATTLAVGEEGGEITDSLTEGGDATTQALGEEGGDFTTLALGEEGGDFTTLALGEEGGCITDVLCEDGSVTTFALGEEGGAIDGDVTTQALGEEGGMTTLALGEEGGEISQGIGDVFPSSGNLNSVTTALEILTSNEYSNSG